ncbi:hypothetical protein PVAP13_2NG272300 [Panicum virgatum]|uniref:Uncharacterized protein n=1 Tax=Panicum virgatum TaxID=38727 RepID=A0A8T0VJ45_PANVG|nr:hypothetical protein PVAP13_2NG272300 [Panicum virgatum]
MRLPLSARASPTTRPMPPRCVPAPSDSGSGGRPLLRGRDKEEERAPTTRVGSRRRTLVGSSWTMPLTPPTPRPSRPPPRSTLSGARSTTTTSTRLPTPPPPLTATMINPRLSGTTRGCTLPAIRTSSC